MKILSYIFLTLVFPIASFAQDVGDSVYVSIRQTKLKNEPYFLASSNADLKYGDSLKIVSKKGEWIKVQDRTGKNGFIHTSAISSRKIILNSDSKYSPGSKSSEDGIVLAGKGFNKEIENKYATINSNLNYAAVDRMERIKISTAELNQFVVKGKLKSN